MSSLVSLTAYGSYTTAYVALTTAWPYTSGCDTQFAFNSLGATTSIIGYNPSLGGIWGVSGPNPRYYSQTQCLPPFLTARTGDSTTYSLQSIVCPESWSSVTASTSTNPNAYQRPYQTEWTCCPPKYTLSCSSTIGTQCYSACFSPISSGQTIIGVPNDYDHRLHTGAAATEFPLTTTLTTFVASESTYVTGYMLTGISYITYPAATYTDGSSSSSYDDSDSAFNRYLAIRLGVGITIPVIFFIVSGIILFVCLKRRKRRAQGNFQGYPQNQPSNGPMSNVPGQAPGVVASQYAGASSGYHSGSQPSQYAATGPNQYAQHNPNQYAGAGPNQYPPAGPNQYSGAGPNQYSGTGPNQYAGAGVGAGAVSNQHVGAGSPQYAEAESNPHVSPVSPQYAEADSSQFGGAGPSQYSETVPNQHAPSSPNHYAGGAVNREVVEAPNHGNPHTGGT